MLKGEFLLGGFIAIKPENEVGKQLQLLANLREDRPRRPLPGLRGLVQAHAGRRGRRSTCGSSSTCSVKNELVGGTLTVDGEPVDLDAISCPINMLAGATDHITPPAQVFALADHVSTPPADMLARTTTGGHLGLFMGTEALRDHWPS